MHTTPLYATPLYLEPPYANVVSDPRECAVEAALCDEYDACFWSVMAQSSTYAHLMQNFRNGAVSLIASSRLPLLEDAVADRINAMHAVPTAICLCFLRHLQQTWFAIGENASGAVRRLGERLAGRAYCLRVERKETLRKEEELCSAGALPPSPLIPPRVPESVPLKDA